MVEEIEYSRYSGRVICSILNSSCLFDMKRVGHRKWHGEKSHKHFGWSAGPTALRILCHENPEIEIINLVGFDLYGITGKVNNVYTNTRNYAKSTRGEVSSTSWISQLLEVFKMFPDIMFYRVGSLADQFPEVWKGLDNIKFRNEVFI